MNVAARFLYGLSPGSFSKLNFAIDVFQYMYIFCINNCCFLNSGVSRNSFRGGVQIFFVKVGVFAWHEAPCSAWRSHAFARGVRGHAPPRKF